MFGSCTLLVAILITVGNGIDLNASRKRRSDNQGDPCPSGWKQNGQKCYYFSQDKAEWAAAREKCFNLDNRADLTSILDKEEYDFVFGQMYTAVWIGLNQQAKEGVFVWSDGTPVTYTKWEIGEPNNLGAGEKCAESYGLFREEGRDEAVWNDNGCSFSRQFACKLRADQCPDNWEQLNGFCYYFSDYRTNWDEARSKCLGLQNGADLISINSEEENRFIADHLHMDSWIGLHNMSNYGDFVWSDGNLLEYPKWGFTQPKNGDNNKCGQMLAYRDYWSNIDCLSERKYICKIDRALQSNALRGYKMPMKSAE